MSKFFNLEKGIYARDKTVVYPERTIRCIGHTFWPISKRGVLPTLTRSFARHSFLLGLGLVFSISTCQCSLHTLKSLWGDSLCISLKELLCLQSCHKKTSTLDQNFTHNQPFTAMFIHTSKSKRRRPMGTTALMEVLPLPPQLDYIQCSYYQLYVREFMQQVYA